MGTRWMSRRVAIGVGLAAGAVFGFTQFLVDRSLLASIIKGLFFGAFMSFMNYWGVRNADHLSGLSFRQRLEVAASVRQGRPVAEPALSQATLRHAQLVQESARPRRWAYALVWLLAGASAIVLVLAALSRDLALVVVGAFSLVMWIVILVVGPLVDRRRTANARAAMGSSDA